MRLSTFCGLHRDTEQYVLYIISRLSLSFFCIPMDSTSMLFLMLRNINILLLFLNSIFIFSCYWIQLICSFIDSGLNVHLLFVFFFASELNWYIFIAIALNLYFLFYVMYLICIISSLLLYTICIFSLVVHPRLVYCTCSHWWIKHSLNPSLCFTCIPWCFSFI
jgi:hypothetical protein